MSTVPASQSAPAAPSPEERFLDYARTGNKAIIQALIVEFADRSYNQARRIIGRNDGAEDAMQEAYMRLVHTAKKYDGSVPFAAWLGRLVSAAAINYRQRHVSRHINLSGMSDQGAAPMNKQTPDSESADSPELHALRAALDSLPDRYRTPMTMHYFGGLDQSETAAALGISARTIETQLSRGLERLREKLCRAGFAMTSAGLLTVFATIPTYAAPPALKANLTVTASERLVALASKVGHGFLGAKKISALFGAAGFFKAAVAVSALAVVAMATLSLPRNHGAAPDPTMALEKGLVGYWRLDETSGRTAADSSGNGFDAQLNKDTKPVWIAGKAGGALDFDGFYDHAYVGSPIALTNLSRYTIAAWIMPRSFGNLDESSGLNLGRIVNKRNHDREWAAGWSLYLSNLEAGSTSGFVHFRQTFSVTDGVWMTPNDSVVLGAWQHVALTFDNSSVDNRPVFYLNGNPVATLVDKAPAGSVSSDAESNLVIGNTDAPIRGFDGAIDEVRLYDRILNAAEIDALVARDLSTRK